MKNDAECVPPARSQTTDAVPEIHSIVSALTAGWSIVDRERNGVSFRECNDFCSRLHAGTLLYKNEFSAGEVPSRLR